MEEKCLFCEIIHGEKLTDFLYQDDSIVVFKDIRPQAPVHLLIVPKKHIRSVNDIGEEDSHVLSNMILTAKKMAKEFSVDRTGYRLFMNVEKGGGQVIFHLHLHLTGGG